MTDKDIEIKFRNIYDSLSARRLKPVFDLLGQLISVHGLGIYYDEYRNLEENYQFMLKYTVEGVFDPERLQVYHKLLVSVFDLADKLNEALKIKYSHSFIYVNKRSFGTSFIQDTDEWLAELEASLRESLHDEAGGPEEPGPAAGRDLRSKMQRFFHHVWYTDRLTTEEADNWRRLIRSTILPLPYRSYMVSAVILSLRRYFDPVKFMILFDACSEEEPEISLRAIVGLIISCYEYDYRLPYYHEIHYRLGIIAENPSFKRSIERILLQFIRSKETEKLQQRIRDEILPEMIRISPNLKNKINLDSLMKEGFSEDKNPEWEDIFRDSPGLLNKMEEFSEMQMKGDDVFMGSFSMLKSFPFFNMADNWFMPFFPENPDVEEVLNSADPAARNLMETIDRVPILCNSDKYSFCFSIQKMTGDNLGFISNAMQGEMEQIRELKEDEELVDPGRRNEFISNRYIQDLYRFYKLFPRKEDFEDIFSWRLDFHNRAVLGKIIKQDRLLLRNIAEYYFAREHYEEASEIFNHLLEEEKSGELYQKIAWGHQKSGDFGKALDYYLKAELYDVNRLWNTKRIAFCYRNLRKPAKALDYYREAEKHEPDNLGTQINIGNCLLEMHEYHEALQCYFKVEYLAPGKKNVWRTIGWCSFLTGKKEQAEQYFRKLIDEQPGKHDLINMGHVQWSMGKRQSALDYYKRSISKNSTDSGNEKKEDREITDIQMFSEQEFMEAFEEDLDHLLAQGVDREEIPIMLDKLRYFLEE